ncbi:hypothetical protein [Pseudomonas wenzhouensis]|uniref:hypothetical protein n=1 Tax=Pseudomonas wenzhouensis TaxID=2906062 RepID=UPI001E319502|nr:hypothetical protein [Pseudomonas wenzhouensis]UFQ98682.1 hypothetical protein J7655_05645 [Pseudomonas wenzhouensis]
MSSVKYLCIDDQPEDFIQPLLSKLSNCKAGLNFDRMHPQEFESQFERINALAREEQCFGLLIDLRLDQDADLENGNRVYYRGPTLAQELRTRMAEGVLPSFPIVLWSMNDNIVHSYAPDSSSHDLFDAVYAKDDGQNVLGESVALELFWLAAGYQKFNKVFEQGAALVLEGFLGLDEDDRSYLDPRLISFLKGKVVYEMAGKILNTLIRSEGVLVSEIMLAARLGVDIVKSDGSWSQLLSEMNSASYSGIFHEAWPRWWMHRVDAWWAEIVAYKASLRKYSAPERIAIINEKFGLNLVAATPIEDSYSVRYSTVCVATGRPLDPVDGFKVFSPLQDAWQDNRYVSTYAVLQRVKKTEWVLDPLEVERFKQLTDRLKNEKKN